MPDVIIYEFNTEYFIEIEIITHFKVVEVQNI